MNPAVVCLLSLFVAFGGICSMYSVENQEWYHAVAWFFNLLVTIAGFLGVVYALAMGSF